MFGRKSSVMKRFFFYFLFFGFILPAQSFAQATEGQINQMILKSQYFFEFLAQGNLEAAHGLVAERSLDVITQDVLKQGPLYKNQGFSGPLNFTFTKTLWYPEVANLDGADAGVLEYDGYNSNGELICGYFAYVETSPNVLEILRIEMSVSDRDVLDKLDDQALLAFTSSPGCSRIQTLGR